jgi:hypothetical protein
MDMMDDKMVMDDGGGSMDGMATSFLPWETYKGTILFDFWKVETKWEFALTWFAIVALAVIYHAIRFLIYTLEEYMYKPVHASGSGSTGGAGGSSSSSSSSSSGGGGGGGGSAMVGQEGYQRLPDDKDPELGVSPDPTRGGGAAPTGSMESTAPSQYMLLRALHALISGFNYGVALLLMLVAMTYNPSLFLALMFGYALGDFIFFSWTRPASVAQDCH